MKQSLYSLIFLLSITTLLSAADSNIVPASTGIYIIGPATISQPGSYIVAQDIMGTITITADNVFLDLNEKTLFAPAGGNGIEVIDQENIEIRNGIIDGLVNLSVNGVFLESCTTVLLEDLIIQGHGQNPLLSGGITLSHCSLITIKSSVIKESRSYGIVGGELFLVPQDNVLITDCIVERNFVQGITLEGNNITITNCQANSNGDSGILVIVLPGAGLITGCIANNNGSFGIQVDNIADGGELITNCIANNNGVGIQIELGDITNCSANQNLLEGIVVFRGSMTYCTTSSNTIRGFSIEGGEAKDCASYYNGTFGCRVVNSLIQNSDLSFNGISGIDLFDNSIARSNIIRENIGDGLRCIGMRNLIEGNSLSNNGLSGINNSGIDNSFFNNKAQQNGPTQTENYSGVPASTIAVFDLSTGTFISTPTICCDVNLSIVP